MKRGGRIALELLAPAPLGLLVLWFSGAIWTAVRSGRVVPREVPRIETVFLAGAVGLLCAYIFAGIPSLVFTAVMERAFKRGLNPASWRSVALSTVLGGFAGGAIEIAMFWDKGGFAVYGIALFFAVGAAVGFLIGFTIRNSSRETAAGRLPGGWILAGIGGWLALAWTITRNEPPWFAMWAIAFAEFAAIKWITLSHCWRAAPAHRLAGYLFLWPGLDAPAFLGLRATTAVRKPLVHEWAFALVKTVAGAATMLWAGAHAREFSPLLVGWIGMIGFIFALHFGVLHLASLAWRREGVNAKPLMRWPLLACSLSEFWSERWNTAFADAARRFVGRPLARRWGAGWTTAFVFLVSGLVHESVISVPARGGWGGPTLYFLIEGAGVAFEKTAWARRHGLGRGFRGWLWTSVVTIAPVPLLFHPAFVTRVMTPFFEKLAALLP